MKPTVTLTQEQIEFFRREGYLAIETLTSPQEVEQLRNSYDRIFSEKAGREIGDQFDLAGTDEEGEKASLPQILNPAKYAPEMKGSQLLVNAQAVARQLLGEEASCEFAHAILKPAGHGAETPWHQDAAYWPPDIIYDSISIWVPLQNATEENGCMQFVPGSHKLDVLTHRSMGDDPRVHALELAPDETHHVKNAVKCPLPPGGATLHGSYVLHYAGPNRSEMPRRALILNAGLPPKRRSQPKHFPWLEEKRTARQRRVDDAIARGEDVAPPPTGKLE
jgi:ectoine hydroxylase-related dioxygenase (phytanoyl-CoA dioxygenase family)